MKCRHCYYLARLPERRRRGARCCLVLPGAAACSLRRRGPSAVVVRVLHAVADQSATPCLLSLHICICCDITSSFFAHLQATVGVEIDEPIDSSPLLPTTRLHLARPCCLRPCERGQEPQLAPPNPFIPHIPVPLPFGGSLQSPWHPLQLCMARPIHPHPLHPSHNHPNAPSRSAPRPQLRQSQTSPRTTQQ